MQDTAPGQKQLDAPTLEKKRAHAIAYFTGMDAVEGWLSPTTGMAIFESACFQQQLEIQGGFAEIGIHHGKSFFALLTAANAHEKCFAIDLFAKQELNVDNSGSGDREKFLSHLQNFFPQRKVDLIQCSSRELLNKEQEFGLKNIRFFSIDGGHTRALTLNDLRIADRTLIEGGLCCLDDVLNSRWPGVLTGLYEFLNETKGLVPLAYFPNKLFLCRPAYLGQYREFFRNKFRPELEKSGQELHRSRIDVYRENWPGLLSREQPSAFPDPLTVLRGKLEKALHSMLNYFEHTGQSFELRSTLPGAAFIEDHTYRRERALSYLSHSQKIPGGLSPTAGLATFELALLQEKNGLTGNFAEKGVREGKSLLLFAAAAREKEKLYILNEVNPAEKWFLFLNFGRIFPAVSVMVTPKAPEPFPGGLRFLSLGYIQSAKDALAGLLLAERALTSGGLCCIDNVFNYHSTQSSTALFSYLSKSPRLLPFASFPNRIFLCQPDFQAQYASHLRALFGAALLREKAEFGAGTIDIYGECKLADFKSKNPAGSSPVFSKAEDLEQSILSLENHIQSHLDSLSWKVTHPLRVVAKALGFLVCGDRWGKAGSDALSDRSQRLAALETVLSSILNSFSWRVSRPLRFIARGRKI